VQYNFVLGELSVTFYTFLFSQYVMRISFNLYNDSLTVDKEQASIYKISDIDKYDISWYDALGKCDGFPYYEI